MVGDRDGVFAGALAAAAAWGLALALGCGSAAAQHRAPKAVPGVLCGTEEFPHGVVSRVIDGRTFVLDDGREVRLAAIEVPLSMAADAQTGLAASAARDALSAVVADAQIVLRRAEFPLDRYGRTMAYAYAVRAQGVQLIQAELISGGFARVGEQVGQRECARELLRRESEARRGKAGLWNNPYYDALAAEKPADVLAQSGRFALVEGKVVSVRESGATIYINFGRRWSQDFAVTILKRNERSFKAAGIDVRGLAGHRVRVRGYIEARAAATEGGARRPWIEAAHPEQIEAAELN